MKIMENELTNICIVDITIENKIAIIDFCVTKNNVNDVQFIVERCGDACALEEIKGMNATKSVKDERFFTARVTLFEDGNDFKFFSISKNMKEEIFKIEFDPECRLGGIEEMYSRLNNWIIFNDNGLKIYRYSANKEDFLEEKLLKKIEKIYPAKYDLIKDNRKTFLEYQRENIHRNVWIFMDRPNKADDNAEILFKYALEKNSAEIECFFVISKDASDFQRLKKLKNVVIYGSMEHQKLLTIAKLNITSHSRLKIYAPHPKKEHIFYRGFLGARRCFLQHGIMVSDLSRKLCKKTAKLRLFVTSAPEEKASIMNPSYGYNEDVVKMTGLPRFDKLYNTDENYILYMPTWNKKFTKKGGKKVDITEYIKTSHFENINAFLNDEKLYKILDKFNFKILFKPHTHLRFAAEHWKLNDRVEFSHFDQIYRDCFAKAKLAITDTSSAIMDVAYLKKPIIYYQFGEKNHKAGYFDYKTMGFGKVTTELSMLLEEIEKNLENKCEMDKEYQDRVTNFFAFNDQKNCERVYNELLTLNKSY